MKIWEQKTTNLEFYSKQKEVSKIRRNKVFFKYTKAEISYHQQTCTIKKHFKSFNQKENDAWPKYEPTQKN